MTSTLAHRGPDGTGGYVNGRVGLGHRRLSIIDLSTGDQPIYNEDRSIVIVFNGEIYNYKELRRALVDRGHRFSTKSDTEVIVHLYEDHGDDCVDHLNGMFAFAIWDSKRQRLLAVRDRLGEKPLYYAHHRGKLQFASELKSIVTDRSIPRDIDPEALNEYLAYGYVPAPRTIFRSVQKLPAGHRLVWENGKLSTNRYWTAQFPTDSTRTEQDWTDELRGLLEDSIRLRLRSDVPVGAFLSGGLDSNGIVAVASRLLDRPLQTFSVGFGERGHDELALARLTADRYQTDHHEIIVKDTDTSILGELVAHFDEPFADPSMLPTYYIAREARRFVKVCLSGDAGDEVFGGYKHYRRMLRYAKVDAVPAFVRRAVFGTVASLLPNHVRGKGLLNRLAASSADRYQREVGIFDSDERRLLLQPEIADRVTRGAELFEPYFSANGLDPLSTCQLVDQNTYLPEDICVKVDRAAMKNSLEVRIPYLDHRIVELVNAMPPQLKVRGKTQKYVLRQLLTGVVPDEVLAGPKRGFGIPIKHWFRGRLKSVARDLLLSPSSRCHRYVNPAFVQRLLDAHDRGRRDLSERIWTLLVLEEWCRAFDV